MKIHRYFFLSFMQIRARGIQRPFLARRRREHEGSTVVSAGTRTGADAAVPRGGCPRLTHTLSPCSAMRQSLSRTYYRNDTLGLCECNSHSTRPSYLSSDVRRTMRSASESINKKRRDRDKQKKKNNSRCLRG